MFCLLVQFSSVHLLRRVRLFATPWTTACQASLSITNSRSFSNLCLLSQWCHPTISSSVIPLLLQLQSFTESGSFQMSQLFTLRWPKYWSFSFNISPSNESYVLSIIIFHVFWSILTSCMIWARYLTCVNFVYLSTKLIYW